MSAPLTLSPGAALLSRLWRMRGQDAPRLSDSGDEFDSEALVSFRANRDPRVYQDPVRSNRGERVKLHLALDCSGSMAHMGRGAAARRLAVMVSQSAIMAGIPVHPVAYGSCLYRLPVLQTLPQVSQLDAWLGGRGHTLGSTNTAGALALIYQAAVADPSALHIVLVVTDGSPDSVPMDRTAKKVQTIDGRWTTRAAVELMLEAGLEVFGFMVADEPSTAAKVKACFGPDRYAVAPTDHAAAMALCAVVERFV